MEIEIEYTGKPPKLNSEQIAAYIALFESEVDDAGDRIEELLHKVESGKKLKKKERYELDELFEEVEQTEGALLQLYRAFFNEMKISN